MNVVGKTRNGENTDLPQKYLMATFFFYGSQEKSVREVLNLPNELNWDKKNNTCTGLVEHLIQGLQDVNRLYTLNCVFIW